MRPEEIGALTQCSCPAAENRPALATWTEIVLPLISMALSWPGSETMLTTATQTNLAKGFIKATYREAPGRFCHENYPCIRGPRPAASFATHSVTRTA